VNGAAPLLISLVILLPLWSAQAGLELPWSPLHLAVVVALLLVFLLGVFLGRIARVAWWLSGLKAALIALLTTGLILVIAGG